jgi:integrase/recombinase XerC
LSARRGELVQANLSDLDLESGTLAVLGKGRSEKETLTLAEATITALKAWLDVRGMEPGPLFSSLDRAGKGDGRLTGRAIHQIVKRLGKEIGIDTRPHGLRHSGITQAIKLVQRHQHEEPDPDKRILFDEVLQYSRHKNLKTLMIYRDNERNVQGQITRMVAESV